MVKPCGLIVDGNDNANIAVAARLLEAGELVAFATETVYGLGADADNSAAVARIYAAKGRPANHPVIVHIAPEADVLRWALEVPDFARALIDKFWPGPLTLVLNKRPGVADACSGGQATLALRSPNHPVALALLRDFKHGQGGLAAPSANRFGRVSPTTAQHVADELGDQLSAGGILDGGACAVGIESAIVDCTRGAPRVLRFGMITEQQIMAVTGAVADVTSSTVPRVSGNLASHYAPNASVQLADTAAYKLALQTALDASQPCASMGFAASGARWHVQMPRTPHAYAQALYSSLRHLDFHQPGQIWVELPDQAELQAPAWQGVVDRLRRAAHR